MNFVILGLLCMLPFSSASWGWGPCKKYEIVTDADLEKYYGTWYHIVTDSTFVWSKRSSCVRGDYSPIEGEHYFQVVNSAVRNGDWFSNRGKAKVREDGRLEVKFAWIAPWGDYEIVDTDYNTYSIVHSCQNYFLFHHDINFLIARKNDYQPPKEQIDTMIELGTNEEHVEYYDQSMCPPFPGVN